ncbi:MAG: hypothetical protein D6807_07375 [Alphaproteobacteria bacterium]|nr:MAG: hypothetical protein D6807_07375 [Alphaproteobacteria bacterium]
MAVARRGRGGLQRFRREAPREALCAAHELERGLERLAGRGWAPGARPESGLSLRPGRWPRSESLAGPERDEETARLLRQWAQRVRGEGGNLEAVLSLVVDGASFASVDRRWRRRNGWARAQLGRAVDLFMELNARDP